MGPAVFLGSPPTLNTHLVPPGVCGTWPLAVFPGSPPTHRSHLVPPGVCGTWPLLAVWDPRFSRAHRQPTTPYICLNTTRKIFVTQCPQPKCQHNHSHRRDRHETNRITAPHQQSAHINSDIARLPDCDGQAADAVSAYTQVKMEDAPRLLRIQKSECPDVWIRLPRHIMANIIVNH